MTRLDLSASTVDFDAVPELVLGMLLPAKKAAEERERSGVSLAPEDAIKELIRLVLLLRQLFGDCIPSFLANDIAIKSMVDLIKVRLIHKARKPLYM